MIVDFVSRDYLSVTLDRPELFRVLDVLALDIKITDVCKVSVNILLWPLDKRDLHAKIELPAHEQAESLELFPTEP